MRDQPLNNHLVNTKIATKPLKSNATPHPKMIIQVGWRELEDVLHLAILRLLTGKRFSLEFDYVLDDPLEILLFTLSHLLHGDFIRVANAVLAQKIQFERVHGRGGHFNVLSAKRAAAHRVCFVLVFLATNTKGKIVDDPRSSDQLRLDA
jgi:hypothetical protein